MKNIRKALELGARTVIAMTCWRCGVLLPGSAFEKYRRRQGQRAYIDRRCSECRWRHLTDPMKRGNAVDRMAAQ